MRQAEMERTRSPLASIRVSGLRASVIIGAGTSFSRNQSRQLVRLWITILVGLLAKKITNRIRLTLFKRLNMVPIHKFRHHSYFLILL